LPAPQGTEEEEVVVVVVNKGGRFAEVNGRVEEMSERFYQVYVEVLLSAGCADHLHVFASPSFPPMFPRWTAE
jgi:hypothetical protein